MTWVKSAAVTVLAAVLGMSGALIGHARADGHRSAPRIFAVGHSWVVGTSSGHQMGYVDALVRSSGVQRVDADHSGFMAAQVRSLVDAAPQCRPSDLAIVQVGLNDVRRHGERGLPTFRRAMRAILGRLDTCPVILVQEPGALNYRVRGKPLRGSDDVVRDYRQATATLAARHPNVTLVTPQVQANDYLADGLHPDLSGNRRIARAIRETSTWRAFVRAT